MTPQPLRLGVVGAGRVFERLYRPALLSTPSLRLVAACDPLPPLTPLPDGVTFYPAMDEMLAAGGLDGIAILTPPRLHAPQAVRALESGLRVFIEKPTAMSLDEIKTILAAGPQFGVAFARRHWQPYRRLTPAVTSFEIETNIAGWNSRDATSMEPPAFDLLPHFIDLACTAKATAPVAVSGSCSQRTAHAALRFPDGSIVHCRAAHGETYFERVTTGRRTTQVNQSGLVKVALARLKSRPRTHVDETAALLEAWATGRPAPGPRDAWVAVATVEALHRAAESGREEPVEPWPY